MVRVKICGLSRPGDIDAVNRAQPAYVGFIFADSHRRVTPAQAAALRGRLHPAIRVVGVFADEVDETMLSLAGSGVIDLLQLHGRETEETVVRIKCLTGKPVIKAIAVQRSGDAQQWAASAADYLLLDGRSGGGGQIFDWTLIGKIGKPYFLAGGLCPGNVTAAIRQTAPFAVDVSSGVETDGRKDPAKIEDFIGRVRHG